MTPSETAAQLRLAADILETGHPFEYKPSDSSPWVSAKENGPLLAIYERWKIRPILARPPYEAELHNPDGLTAEQVGVGYRLLLPDEMQPEKYEWGFKNPNGSIDWMYGSQNEETAKQCNPKYAVRVSLSVPWPEQPDPYAELKKAHAEGKVIQTRAKGVPSCTWGDEPRPKFDGTAEYRIKPDDLPAWIEWHGGPCPLKDEEVEEWSLRYKSSKGMDLGGDEVPKVNVAPSQMRWENEGNCSDIIAYRVLKWREKKPKVALGPDDVPPGSVLLSVTADANGMRWTEVTCSKDNGVEINGRLCVPWEELKTHWQINRSIPMTGKWNANAWEACEK